MVTQVNARAGQWLDGVQVAANDLRLQAGSSTLTATAATGTTGIAATQGVRPGQGSPLLSTWTSGMAFTLNAGTCYIVGTASGTAGVYTATLDTTTTLTVPNGDPANPRIDSVIAVVSDVGTSSSTTIFKILPGTPAGSPAAPTLPANAIRLANIAVAALASVLSAPNFTDLRTYTVGSGGILPVASSAGTQNGPAGAYEHDLSTGRLKVLNGSGAARAPLTTSFSPAAQNLVSNNTIANGGATNTLLSLGVSTDGYTEVQITASWSGFQSVTPAVGVAVQVAVFMDGTQIGPAQCWVQQSTTPYQQGSGTISVYAAPTNGSHTFSLQAKQYGVGGTDVTMLGDNAGTAVGPIQLRVAPAAN